jgi:His/Glu/Gln/Arg/opine family amino acid ABC transporter permease subunit
MLLIEVIDCFVDNFPLFFVGFFNTLQIWLISSIISLFFGFFWGMFREKRLFMILINRFFDLFAYIIQGIPFYIQLLISFFIIGPYFYIENSIFIGIFSLGFCSAAYTSQIVKSSCNSVPKDQWELARNVGYNRRQTMYYIIFPQMFEYAIPLFINECDQLLKSISILSTLGILDFTRSGLNVINDTLRPIPVYIILLVVYLSCSLILRYIAYLYKNNLKNETVFYDYN